MHVDSSGVDTSINDAGQSTDEEEIPAVSTEPEVDAAPAAGTESDPESLGIEGSVAQHDSSAGELTLIDTALTAESLGESAQDPDADLRETAAAADSGDVALIPLTSMFTAEDSAMRGSAGLRRVHEAGQRRQ